MSQASPPPAAPPVDSEPKAKGGSKIFVTVGTVYEFDTVSKAEKFLNEDNAPAEFTVLRGKRIGRSTKVSLR